MTTTSLNNDKHLIQSFRSGSVQAIEVLINQYKDKIYLAIRLLAPEPACVEDIFRHVFVTIIDSIRNLEYDEDRGFLATAIRIAYRLSLATHRQEELHKSVSKGPIAYPGSGDHFSTGAPGKELNNDQDPKSGFKQLQGLTGAQREAIALRHFGELSFGEIATLTGYSLPFILLLLKQGLNCFNQNVAATASCI